MAADPSVAGHGRTASHRVPSDERWTGAKTPDDFVTVDLNTRTLVHFSGLPSAVRPVPDGLGFDAELGDGLCDALRGLLGQAASGESAALDFSATAACLLPPAGFADAWRVVQYLENQDLTYVGHSGAARRHAGGFDGSQVLVCAQPQPGRDSVGARFTRHTDVVYG